MRQFSKLIISFLLPLTALAENYGFLANSAMSYFTKEDWEIFYKTQDQVLNRGKEGVQVMWKNPKSGSYGSMIPAAAPSQNGMPCRYVSFFNTANKINGEGTYKFCKSSNNKWNIY